MKEIIVIRTSDPDGSIFRSILGALQGKDVQILHAADLDPSALTLGDIEIFPEQRRVTKAGVEVCLNYGEFSILCCMARRPDRLHGIYSNRNPQNILPSAACCDNSPQTSDTSGLPYSPCPRGR